MSIQLSLALRAIRAGLNSKFSSSSSSSAEKNQDISLEISRQLFFFRRGGSCALTTPGRLGSRDGAVTRERKSTPIEGRRRKNTIDPLPHPRPKQSVRVGYYRIIRVYGYSLFKSFCFSIFFQSRRSRRHIIIRESQRKRRRSVDARVYVYTYTNNYIRTIPFTLRNVFFLLFFPPHLK